MYATQNIAVFHTVRETIPDIAIPAGTSHEISDLEIETVFIIFFSWCIVHGIYR